MAEEINFARLAEARRRLKALENELATSNANETTPSQSERSAKKPSEGAASKKTEAAATEPRAANKKQVWSAFKSAIARASGARSPRNQQHSTETNRARVPDSKQAPENVAPSPQPQNPRESAAEFLKNAFTKSAESKRTSAEIHRVMEENGYDDPDTLNKAVEEYIALKESGPDPMLVQAHPLYKLERIASAPEIMARLERVAEKIYRIPLPTAVDPRPSAGAPFRHMIDSAKIPIVGHLPGVPRIRAVVDGGLAVATATLAAAGATRALKLPVVSRPIEDTMASVGLPGKKLYEPVVADYSPIDLVGLSIGLALGAIVLRRKERGLKNAELRGAGVPPTSREKSLMRRAWLGMTLANSIGAAGFAAGFASVHLASGSILKAKETQLVMSKYAEQSNKALDKVLKQFEELSSRNPQEITETNPDGTKKMSSLEKFVENIELWENRVLSAEESGEGDEKAGGSKKAGKGTLWASKYLLITGDQTEADIYGPRSRAHGAEWPTRKSKIIALRTELKIPEKVRISAHIRSMLQGRSTLEKEKEAQKINTQILKLTEELKGYTFAELFVRDLRAKPIDTTDLTRSINELQTQLESTAGQFVKETAVPVYKILDSVFVKMLPEISTPTEKFDAPRIAFPIDPGILKAITRPPVREHAISPTLLNAEEWNVLVTHYFPKEGQTTQYSPLGNTLKTYYPEFENLPWLSMTEEEWRVVWESHPVETWKISPSQAPSQQPTVISMGEPIVNDPRFWGPNFGTGPFVKMGHLENSPALPSQWPQNVQINFTESPTSLDRQGLIVATGIGLMAFTSYWLFEWGTYMLSASYRRRRGEKMSKEVPEKELLLGEGIKHMAEELADFFNDILYKQYPHLLQPITSAHTEAVLLAQARKMQPRPISDAKITPLSTLKATGRLAAAMAKYPFHDPKSPLVGAESYMTVRDFAKSWQERVKKNPLLVGELLDELSPGVWKILDTARGVTISRNPAEAARKSADAEAIISEVEFDRLAVQARSAWLKGEAIKTLLQNYRERFAEFGFSSADTFEREAVGGTHDIDSSDQRERTLASYAHLIESLGANRLELSQIKASGIDSYFARQRISPTRAEQQQYLENMSFGPTPIPLSLLKALDPEEAIAARRLDERSPLLEPWRAFLEAEAQQSRFVIPK